MFDSEWVICPHCGHKHGDAFEWSRDTTPSVTTCDDCGEPFTHWADYDVTYNTAPVSE